MMKQMRERAGNLQPQFLLMALLLSICQPHGFVGKVWKAELPWLEVQRQQFPGRPAQGGWSTLRLG